MALLESSGLNTQPTACGAAAEPTPSPWAPLGQPPPRLGLQPPSKPSAAPLQGQATGNSPALPDTLAGLGLQSSMFNPGGSGGGLCLPFGLHTPRIPADGKSTPQVGGALSSSLPAFFQNFGDRGVNGGGGGLDETLEPAGIAPAAATSSIDEATTSLDPLPCSCSRWAQQTAQTRPTAHPRLRWSRGAVRHRPSLTRPATVLPPAAHLGCLRPNSTAKSATSMLQ